MNKGKLTHLKHRGVTREVETHGNKAGTNRHNEPGETKLNTMNTKRETVKIKHTARHRQEH